MSIFINGLEIPKEGTRTISISSDGNGFVYVYGSYPTELHKVVSVSTPHGRLIDTDVLKEWIEAWFTMHRSYHPYSKSNLIPSTELIDIIDRLPTIIEAEEGETKIE